MCTASRVAERARTDGLAAFPATHDLGIVRDPARCAQQRSAHCCGDRAEDPDARGLNVVLAWDCGHAVGDRATAKTVREAFLTDPRVHYVISFGELYYRDGDNVPDRDNTGHEDHVHVTFYPWAANDDRPFTFASQGDLTIMDTDTKAYLDAKFLSLAVTLDKLEADVAELRDAEKRHNAGDRRRDQANHPG